METTLTSRKKLIDINGDTFRTLSVMAAENGTNLKKFIENILDAVATNHNDENSLYSRLLRTDPDGQVPATETETKEFEAWLGV